MRLHSKTIGPQLPQQSIDEDVNDECGIGNLKFTEAELSDSNGDKVKWSRY